MPEAERNALLYDFNPRPPRGGRRGTTNVYLVPVPFQSTPPARGATVKYGKQSESQTISIHAPREGGDFPFDLLRRVTAISIHAPREGGDRLR